MHVRDIRSRRSRPVSRPVHRERSRRGIGVWSVRLILTPNGWSLAAVEGQTLEGSKPVALGGQRRDRLILLWCSALRWREGSRTQLVLAAGDRRRVCVQRGRGAGSVRRPYRTRHISTKAAAVVIWVTWLGERGCGSLAAEGRDKGPLERSCSGGGTGKRRLLLLLLLVLPTLSTWGTSAHTDGTRSNATWRLQGQRRTGERGWVDGRHPYPSLVDLEKVGNKGVEVDVRIGKVVEGQLLPVPVYT